MEVLFRGQTRRLGEKIRMNGEKVPSNWAYGGICKGPGAFSIIYGDMNVEKENPIEKFVVYTDTVGMFVGVKDIEDKHKFVVEWDAENTRFIGRTIGAFNKFGVLVQGGNICYIGKEPKVKVIGNVYDNPELLGGEAK